MVLSLFLRPREVIRHSLEEPNIATAIFLNILPALISFISMAAFGIIIAANSFIASLISPAVTTIVLALLTYLLATSLAKIPRRRNFLGIWQAFSFGWVFLAIVSLLFAGFIFVTIPGLSELVHLKANDAITNDEFIARLGAILQNTPDFGFWAGFVGGVSLLLMLYMLIYWYMVLQEVVPTSRLKQLCSYLIILAITTFVGFLRDSIILSVFS